MSDDDMISKTAALEAVKRETGFDDDHPAIAAIAALPAVTAGVRGHMLRSLLAKAVDDLSVGREVDLIALERSVLAALTTTPEGVTPEQVAAILKDVTPTRSDPLASGHTALVKWLRNPWRKCDDVARGPIPEWTIGLMHEAATMLEALAADLARQKARADALKNDKAFWEDRENVAVHRAEAAEAKVARLVEAAIRVAASLAAAISLLDRGGKKAAPSDKMFNQMIVDYKKSLDEARAAITEVQG